MSKLNPMKLFSNSNTDDNVDLKGDDSNGDVKNSGEEQLPAGESKDSANVKASYQAHHGDIPPHRVLSDSEWLTLANRLGAIGDKEKQKAVVPSRWAWAATSMPIGLYRDIVGSRAKYGFLFQMANTTRWTLMVMQLLIGAAITSLGAAAPSNSTTVTVLGATNTVAAGLLALMHNSGLPERYNYDKTQFEELEDHVKEILQVRIVPEGQSVDQVLAECSDMYREAKVTVAVNQPASYNSRKSLQNKIGDKGKPSSAPAVPQSAPEPTPAETKPEPQLQAEVKDDKSDGDKGKSTDGDKGKSTDGDKRKSTEEGQQQGAGKKADKCQLP